eukprot:5405436-Pyramimonas_sp.AAC.1
MLMRGTAHTRDALWLAFYQSRQRLRELQQLTRGPPVILESFFTGSCTCATTGARTSPSPTAGRRCATTA